MLSHKQPDPSLPLGEVFGLSRRLVLAKECYFTWSQLKVFDVAATYLTLVSNADTNVALLYHGAVLQLSGGANNFNQNQNTTCRYRTTATTVSTTLANWFNGAAVNAMTTLKPIVTDYALAAGEDLVLASSASPSTTLLPATGNHNLKVTVFYSVIELE